MGFQLVQSFEVDDGSIDGLSAKLCFVLGVEWEMFFRELKTGKPFVSLVHPPNATRLVRLAERSRRFVEHSDFDDGWVKIVVGGSIDYEG